MRRQTCFCCMLTQFSQFFLLLVRYNFSCSNSAATFPSNKQYVVVKTDENLNSSNHTNFISELESVKNARNMKQFLKNHVR